jgi:hypothetical protein
VDRKTHNKAARTKSSETEHRERAPKFGQKNPIASREKHSVNRTVHPEGADRTIRREEMVWTEQSTQKMRTEQSAEYRTIPARRLESLKKTRARRAKGQAGKEGQGPGGQEYQEDQENQRDQKGQRTRRTDREKACQLALELQLPKFGEVSGKTFPAAEPTEANEENRRKAKTRRS